MKHLTQLEKDRYRKVIEDATKHFGLRTSLKLSGLVEAYVPVDFRRFRVVHNNLNRGRVQQIQAELTRMLRCPTMWLLPSRVHSVLKTAELRISMTPGAHSRWQTGVQEFIDQIFMQMPVYSTRQVWQHRRNAFSEYESTTRFDSGETAVLKLCVDVEAAAFWVLLSVGRPGKQLHPYVAGSWCFRTWSLIMDQLWHMAGLSRPACREPLTSAIVSASSVATDLAQKISDHARR